MLTQFIARQPILDFSGETVGYELLYRSGSENVARVIDGNMASATVIDASLIVGLDLLCGSKRAFINCTEEMLVSGYPEVLSPHTVVLEVLEDIPATDRVIEACHKLKGLGYLLALDDYSSNVDRGGLLALADIIKVEPSKTSLATIAALRRGCAPGVQLLAEKVETWEEVRACAEAGCGLFQGYFYSRPQVLAFQKVRPFPATYLRVMKILSASQLNMAELVRTLKMEPSLCFRLLRYLNSCHFGFTSEIRSLAHGLSLIGEVRFRKWLTIAILAIAGAHSCSELLQTALVRARFCELLAPHVGQREEDLFLTGLLSLFNVVLDVSIEQLVAEVAVSNQVRLGLLENSTPIGRCRELVTTYCAGDWPASSAIASAVNLDETILPPLYVSSLEWARSVSL